MADNAIDLIVIGAGWHGLVAAKTYLQLHPSENIVVLEAEGSCGGTWSADRLYPGLKSNNLHGTYQYPDYDMDEATYGVKPGQEHIPGPVLHQYLTNFAKKFGVFARTRFNTRVQSIEPDEDDNGWNVDVVTVSMPSVESAETPTRLHTKKLIVATGLTSTPNFPMYPGAEVFQAPYFHAKDFCRNRETVATTKRAVVIGGAKSAMDVAYAYAESGAHVDMVIRPTGNGPVWISYPWVMGGKKRLEKLLSVRWMTWFSPCPFGGVDGYSWARNLLHGTWLGRKIVDQFWAGLGGEVIQVNGYASHPELKKLEPWNSAFWTGSGLSIHNYPTDFFQLVKNGQINVHVADVERLTEKTVHLDDGSSLAADVLVCATGWRKEPSLRFINFGTAGIGLPQTPSEQKELATKADKEILTMFPRLRQQPALNFKPKGDPYRMYRFMVPPARMAKRNLAFAGMVSSVSTATAANAQALWISAYLDNKLDIEAATEKEITDEVMLHTQWGRWRYPCGYGATLPDFVFDALPYIDLLLKDLGLRVNRKQSWWAELTEPYSPEDFEGLVEEWTSKQ